MGAGEKRTVEEAVQKSLKDGDKDKQNRRNNVIIFGLAESKESDSDLRKGEDLQKIIGLCKNICELKIEKRDITRGIRLGKITEGKDGPLLVTIKEETMKQDLFQNLSSLREAKAPFNEVIFAHNLPKKKKN